MNFFQIAQSHDLSIIGHYPQTEHAKGYSRLNHIQ